MFYDTTSIYGLIGYPLGHSFSRRYFTDKFEREGINARYENFEIAELGLLSEITVIPELRGFNVTIPYKQAIIPYLHHISPLARKANAVNVVKVVESASGARELWGYNSDCGGFIDDISPLLTPRHNKAIIFGSGGAAQAVSAAFDSQGIESTFVTRRNIPGCLRFDDLSKEIIAHTKLLIQCTPVGMFPAVDTCVDIPYEAIGSEHLCYDVVYNPAPTKFLKRCAEKGATVRGGRGMLIGQAELAWKIWNDLPINIPV